MGFLCGIVGNAAHLSWIYGNTHKWSDYSIYMYSLIPHGKRETNGVYHLQVHHGKKNASFLWETLGRPIRENSHPVCWTMNAAFWEKMKERKIKL